MKDFNFDDNAKKSVFDETNKILEAAGVAPISAEDFAKKCARQEGGNGFMVGEELTLTGAVSIQVVKNADGTGNPFYAAETTDSRFLSLKNLITPNLSGYKFEGDFEENESDGGDITARYTAEALPGFKATEYAKLNMPTRNVVELYAAVKAGKVKLPSKVYLVAKGCRPVVAKTDVHTGSLNYSEGAKRVIRVSVWASAKPKAPKEY